MKKILLAPALIMMVATGCKNKSNNNVTPGSASSAVTSGKWAVSYFYDNDKDETSDYSGYTFEFKSDKTISAIRNSVTTVGTWNEISDDGVQKFVITLSTTNDKLEELNDDWVIESKLGNQLKLKDDNPDRNEQLHFTKQ